MATLIDPTKPAQISARVILKKFMTRELTMKFTAQNRVADKIVLKDSMFGKCVYGE